LFELTFELSYNPIIKDNRLRLWEMFQSAIMKQFLDGCCSYICGFYNFELACDEKKTLVCLTFITTSDYELNSVEMRDSALSFLFLLLVIFSGFNCLISALMSSKRFFFLVLYSAWKRDFYVIWTWQSLCNQPCCGCSFHKIDTTCWTPYDS
jgi:hypothetical protein